MPNDRYAGWVGTVAARYITDTRSGSLSSPSQLEESKHRLAAVAGTSTCHLVQVISSRGTWLSVLVLIVLRAPRVYSCQVCGVHTGWVEQSRNNHMHLSLYQDAIYPGWWMNEGGQSSTGQLIDFVLKTHPSYVKLQQLAATKKISTHECKKVDVFNPYVRLSPVIDLATELQRQISETNCKSATELTRHLHFYPDLHGINWNL